MSELIAVLTSPILYTSIVGILVAFYAVWFLARKQYLGVDKLFNLLALALASGWFAAWVTQSIFNQIWLEPIDLSQLWVHPRPIVILVGYVAIWLVSTRYIRSIRYPYWRLMDMLFIAISIVQCFLLLGWVIAVVNYFSIIALVVSLCSLLGLWWLYSKIHQLGIVSGLHAVLFFGLLLALHFTVPSWQVENSGVEWIADAVGVILGATLVVLRISARTEKVVLQDIPRGVSQNFYETFTRAFNRKSADNEKKVGK